MKVNDNGTVVLDLHNEEERMVLSILGEIVSDPDLTNALRTFRLPDNNLHTLINQEGPVRNWMNEGLPEGWEVVKAIVRINKESSVYSG